MANYSSLKSTIDSNVRTNGTEAITGAVLNTVLNAMVNSLGAGYQYMGVAIPSTNPGTPDQNVFYIAGTEGTYTNFGGIVVANEVAALVWNGSWSKQNTGIKLVSVSQNTLTIGGVDKGELAGQLIENPEWVRVVTDANDRILYGVKTDGKFYFGDGCPPQVVDYVTEILGTYSASDYADVMTFLGNLIDGDSLTTLLATKVDKVTGKSLINADFASAQDALENAEWLQVSVDSNGKLLKGIKRSSGDHYLGGDTYIAGSCFEQAHISKVQDTYNVTEGVNLVTLYNGDYLHIPLTKGNRLRFQVDGNSLSVYSSTVMFLYFILTNTGSMVLPFAHIYDDNIHECDIPEDALGVGIWITNPATNATLTLVVEELSGNQIKKEEIVNKNNQFDLLPPIPDYYFENNYLEDKIATINEAVRSCGTDCDVFIWITDVHWERYNNAGYSPSLIKYIMDRTSIPRVFGGGDYLDGYFYNGNNIYDFMNKMRLAIGSDRFYTAYGNHEFIRNGDYDEAFYDLRQRLNDVIYGNNDKTYFYVDDNQSKTRYIALASFGKIVNGAYTSLYDNDQLTWFTNTALNVESGWTIVIFTHTLYAIEGEDYHLIVSPLIGTQNFIDAINNYNGNGTIACVLIGHTHIDRIHQDEGGVPYIISACDRYEQDVLNGSYQFVLPKTLGTKNEQHFEVVVVDHSNRSIKLISIGSPALNGREDNVGSAVEIREVNY